MKNERAQIRQSARSAYNRGAKDKLHRGCYLLRISIFAPPKRDSIDPYGFAADTRTMVRHTGGAPRQSGDFATAYASGGVGLFCCGASGECCRQRQHQQAGYEKMLFVIGVPICRSKLCNQIGRRN
jgi:hypothetical protein